MHAMRLFYLNSLLKALYINNFFIDLLVYSKLIYNSQELLALDRLMCVWAHLILEAPK